MWIKPYFYILRLSCYVLINACKDGLSVCVYVYIYKMPLDWTGRESSLAKDNLEHE